ncbi:hypothetical protein [Roseibium sp.]|uniref:hypothetical protein n=1 Tax=Roseibium sp. TaxID=1936156 RepID=UPI003BB2013C
MNKLKIIFLFFLSMTVTMISVSAQSEEKTSGSDDKDAGLSIVVDQRYRFKECSTVSEKCLWTSMRTNTLGFYIIDEAIERYRPISGTPGTWEKVLRNTRKAPVEDLPIGIHVSYDGKTLTYSSRFEEAGHYIEYFVFDETDCDYVIDSENKVFRTEIKEINSECTFTVETGNAFK